ncbi:MAG: hypothetical protein HKL90_05910 [Elusimicrobia bacterium]|nr:hypothetical protein [Elusimicrobiota bacterium]
MTNKFLERNKKKSLLAALLLFLREHKVLALLLLLLIGASTVFVSPSAFWGDIPGGSRMEAGIAWLASRMGVDVRRWGLASGNARFGDLLAAFESARAGGKRAGWGPFFAASGDGKSDYGAGSLAYVKGSRADLGEGGDRSGTGAGSNSGSAAGGTGPFKGIVDPAQAAKDGDALTLGPGDVGDRREGFVKAAFAGGFFSGLMGGAGGTGADALSGGAYAGRGFFSGSVGAVSGSAAQAGLANLPTASSPGGAAVSGVGGRISGRFARELQAHESQGMAGASSLGAGRAYTQLAQGNAQAQISVTPNCGAGCPSEFAAANTGAIYDGNAVNNPATNGLVTGTPMDPGGSPNLPSSGLGQTYLQNAQQMNQDAQTCKALDAQYGPQEDNLNAQMQDQSQQFAAASCGSGGCSKSKLNYCNALASQMRATCGQYMSVRCQHSRACPLTAADSASTCNDECNQIGNGISAQKVNVSQDQSGNADGQGVQSAPSH